jgi:hypothetical protein
VPVTDWYEDIHEEQEAEAERQADPLRNWQWMGENGFLTPLVLAVALPLGWCIRTFFKGLREDPKLTVFLTVCIVAILVLLSR